MAQFNFSFEPGTSELYIEALEAAGEIWSGHLGDDVEVNVHLQSASLDAGMLGGALPAFEFQKSYGEVLEGLDYDISSYDDQVATYFLPYELPSNNSFGSNGNIVSSPTSPYTTTTYYPDGYFDPYTGAGFNAVLDGETYQGDAVSLTRANAKALGWLKVTAAPSTASFYLIRTLIGHLTAPLALGPNRRWTSSALPSTSWVISSVL